MCCEKYLYINTFLTSKIYYQISYCGNEIDFPFFFIFTTLHVSHLYTNEADNFIHRSCLSSPSVRDLGTVEASPSSSSRIPLAPLYFFETILYLSSQRNAGRGAVCMETQFQTASVSVLCCCICCSACISVRDTEVCSIL